MATVTVTTYKVLTPEEAEQRRKRMAALIREAELEFLKEEEQKESQQILSD